jgi:hypothetical protein
MDHRGALLGPEESGRISSERWTGFSGSLATPVGSLRIVSGVVVWLGPALTKLLVGVFRGVCCFPCEVLPEGSGDDGLVFLPVF